MTLMERETLSIAERVARTLAGEPIAACLGRLWARDVWTNNLLIVLRDPSQRVSRERRSFRGQTFAITKVSRSLFERDVHRGALGEFVAGILLEPHTTVFGAEYLDSQEMDLKLRIVKEELENLDLRFHELMLELMIDPRFFFHARMQRRAKIDPAARSAYLRLLSDGTDVDSYGFGKALRKLASVGLLRLDGYAKVTRKLMGQLPRPRQRAVMPFREVELAIRRLATYGISGDSLGPSFVQDISRGFEMVPSEDYDLPDPKSYLLLPTESGLVSMDDKRDYEELISSERPSGGPASVRRIGGVLNFVYLLEFGEGDRSRRLVAKSYQNWYGLKWIPLTIWAIGSQNFDILGEKRLANEYRMNRFLRSKGLNAPQIHHVSVPRRTIIEEYVQGSGFDQIARDCLADPSQDLLARISSLGNEISLIHQAGATLGDSKPDNAILDGQGRIWFVDLEQASEGGNPAWDLAEFLYYSGHYTLRWGRMKMMAKAFLAGYLKSGNRAFVREISSARYKRVFGIVTAPHIIMGISKLCGSYDSSS